MPIIMWAYYLICVGLTGLLVWNFVREKKSVDDLILYLIVLIPLVLRVLRVK
jgi:tryptophan-rich sensory protein